MGRGVRPSLLQPTSSISPFIFVRTSHSSSSDCPRVWPLPSRRKSHQIVRRFHVVADVIGPRLCVLVTLFEGSFRCQNSIRCRSSADFVPEARYPSHDLINVLFAKWIYRKTLKGGCNSEALMICSPVFLGVLESFEFGVEEVNVRTAFRCLVVACWSI